MKDLRLFHELMAAAAGARPEAPALTTRGSHTTYEQLSERSAGFASGLHTLELGRFGRVAIYLDKRPETIVAMLGTSGAGGIFVPVNPILKPPQVGHILRDCDVRVLVTSRARHAALTDEITRCPALRHVVLADVASSDELPDGTRGEEAVHAFGEVAAVGGWPEPGTIDVDVGAILYTSGSTGRPKGVVLSHRNLVVGAETVASYIGNTNDDVVLAALPLSFDAGLSQVTTALRVGARVVLHNYLLAKDVLKVMEGEGVTGLTAVPPLWAQLTDLPWPEEIANHLRYVANTGGRLPRSIVSVLQDRLPRTRIFLMYGLTEAFRATYLEPELVDERPDSIGKAIPNAEITVLREDGSPCDPGEPGELVQRGALVALGYWNDPERTAERFRPLPAAAGGSPVEVVTPEIAVFSGDLVRRDEDGFLYFVSRKDEMLKTSGYRVSPTEVEEILHSSGMIAECAAFGIPHATSGHLIACVVKPRDPTAFVLDELVLHCRKSMPNYMIPSRIEVAEADLPRNQNGKIDRKSISAEFTVSPEEAPTR